MNSTKIEIQQINDTSDKYFIQHQQLFDLPMRLLLIGKSQLSGKTTLLINLIGQEWGYKTIFEPDDIFIVSPSSGTEKLMKFKSYMKIPNENIYNQFDENKLEALYETLMEEHGEEPANKKRHKLLIFDDVAYSGKLSSSGKKEENIMDKIFCNSRHYLISVIILAQKYTQLSSCIRENCTGMIMWECSNTQLEKIEEEHNTTTATKKEFMKGFRDATEEKHSFFVINYKYPPAIRFFKGFNTTPIDFKK